MPRVESPAAVGSYSPHSDATFTRRGRGGVPSALRVAAWAVGLAVAAWQAFAYRDWVNADSMSYLDMSDAITSGAWDRLVNATWSPLYPALVGVARLVDPSPAWDFAAAHVVNFVAFVFAMLAFEYLLRGALDTVDADTVDADTAGAPLPRWAAWTLGYALFLWGSLAMLTLMKPTPDMLMSGFLYFGLGLFLRVRLGRDDARTLVALGVTLGLGYLAKAIMFPLGAILVALLVLTPGDVARRVRRVAIAGAAMAVVSLPYAAALSRITHHATIGDAGRVVHLLYIDRVRPAPLWDSTGTASGHFAHPPTRISQTPAAYAYPNPRGVTRAIWFDPAVSSEGVRAGRDYARQWRVFEDNLRTYVVVLAMTAGLLAALGVLMVTAGARGTIDAALRLWPLWLTGAMALGAYAILHVEERYIGAFLAVTWAGALLAFRAPRWRDGVVRAVVALVVVNLGWHAAREIRRDWAGNAAKTHLGDLAAARALHALGIPAGAPVARLNPRVADGWARLARVGIVAEVPMSLVPTFWTATPDAQGTVLDALARAGARAAVGVRERSLPLPAGWRRLDGTDYVAYVLPNGAGI